MVSIAAFYCKHLLGDCFILQISAMSWALNIAQPLGGVIVFLPTACSLLLTRV